MNATPLQWDDSFLIGIDELDFEHRRLIDDLNRLLRELAAHDDKRGIEQCLGDIYARMHAHFALEERVMRINKYADYAEHKSEHEDLLANFTEAMLTFINAGDIDSGGLVEDDLSRWLMQHILTSDRQMSAMIRDRSRD